MAHATVTSIESQFLRLPTEIRYMIYRMVLVDLPKPAAIQKVINGTWEPWRQKPPMELERCCGYCSYPEDKYCDPKENYEFFSARLLPICYCGGFGLFKSVCDCSDPLSTAISLMQTSKAIRTECLPLFLQTNAFDFRGTPDKLLHILSNSPPCLVKCIKKINYMSERIADIPLQSWKRLLEFLSQANPGIHLEIDILLRTNNRGDQLNPLIDRDINDIGPKSYKRSEKLKRWTQLMGDVDALRQMVKENGIQNIQMTPIDTSKDYWGDGCDCNGLCFLPSVWTRTGVPLEECFRKIWATESHDWDSRGIAMDELESKMASLSMGEAEPRHVEDGNTKSIDEYRLELRRLQSVATEPQGGPFYDCRARDELIIIPLRRE